MKYLAILFPVFLLASCGGNDADTQGQEGAAATQVADTALPVADFYKSYTGTIAGQPVVLHLQRAGTVFNATYYYTKQGRPIHLYIQADTARKGYLLAEEQPEVAGSENTSFWTVAMYGDKLARGRIRRAIKPTIYSCRKTKAHLHLSCTITRLL